jgi:hypothetical protein
MSETPTFVLIPAAWCGPGAWDALTPHLEGHVVVSLELPSVRDGADLFADAAAVRQIIDDVGGPVIVVAHSYSGMVLNEVADHPAIQHAVYLTAFWPPEPGASMFSILGAAPEWSVDNGDGTISVTPDPAWARQVMCADLDEDTAADLSSRLGRQSLASFASETTGREHGHPTTYVVCDRDEAIPPENQVAMAAAADDVVHLDAAHFPQVSAAAELARVLTGLPVASARG